MLADAGAGAGAVRRNAVTEAMPTWLRSLMA